MQQEGSLAEHKPWNTLALEPGPKTYLHGYHPFGWMNGAWRLLCLEHYIA